MTQTYNMRVGVSAVIVRGRQILLVEFDDETGVHYNLPGGGVQAGESLHEALRREVCEETCGEVEVGRLLMVWEYEPLRHADKYGAQHKLALVFECHLHEDNEPRLPDTPDSHQTDVRWFPLDALPTTLIPGKLQTLMLESLRDTNPRDVLCDPL